MSEKCCCGGSTDDPNPDCERCELVGKVADLTAKLAAAESELEELRGMVHTCPECGEHCKECECVEKKLAAAEEREAAMRSVIDWFRRELTAIAEAETDFDTAAGYHRVLEMSRVLLSPAAGQEASDGQ